MASAQNGTGPTPAGEFRMVTYNAGASFTAASGRVFEQGKALKLNLREAQEYMNRAGFNVDPVPVPRVKPGSLAAQRAANAKAEQTPESVTEEVPEQELKAEESEEPETTEDAPEPTPKPAAPAKPATAAKPAVAAKPAAGAKVGTASTAKPPVQGKAS